MPSPGRRQSCLAPATRRRLGALLVLISSVGCGSPDPRSGDPGAGDPRRPAAPAGEAHAAPSPPGVEPGIRVLLEDSLHLVRGRRVGLITNHTGIAVRPGNGVMSSIDLLYRHPEVELAALYSPEHGIRGDAEAGERVADGMDEETGLPVHSLYGDTRKPTPEMLAGVDVLLFDIQDIGARYYTYVWTMALAMEAAGENGIPFVVLDRPNPIGGALVQGNVLDPEFSTFVGLYPVPMRHGMTAGELARLLQGEFGIDVALTVAPVRGWYRGMLFEETALPWVAPSPNMPDLTSALHYPGTCLFEGTNLSVGRGTGRPFQQVGAPFLDGSELARSLNDRGLPGVRFEAVRFTPMGPGDGKWDGVEVGGVRFVATGPDYDPTEAAVAALVEARRLAGGAWEWREAHFDRLAGTRTLREGVEAGLEPRDLVREWPGQRDAFSKLAQPYLIYPEEGE